MVNETIPYHDHDCNQCLRNVARCRERAATTRAEARRPEHDPGLTTETPSGVPGVNYSGGVAGYAGPSRPSDKAEPMPQKPTLPLNPADIANQQEEIFRKVIEEVTGDQPKAVQELRTQSQQKVPRKNQTTPQAQQQLQTPRR
jgi:hypothetical protein